MQSGLSCGAFGKKGILERSAMNLQQLLICGIRFFFGWLLGLRAARILGIYFSLTCLWGGVSYCIRGFYRYRQFGFIMFVVVGFMGCSVSFVLFSFPGTSCPFSDPLYRFSSFQ